MLSRTRLTAFCADLQFDEEEVSGNMTNMTTVEPTDIPQYVYIPTEGKTAADRFGLFCFTRLVGHRALK